MKKIVIVGSGPSSLAALHALSPLKHQIILLDIGDTEPIESMEAKTRLQNHRLEAKDFYQAIVPKKNLPHTKKHFGSNYPYNVAQLEESPLAVYSSKSLGGLSTVWGCATLPYSLETIQEWGLNKEEWNRSLEAVSELISFSGDSQKSDPLQMHYPHSVHFQNKLPLTPSLAKIKERYLQKNQDASFVLGQARLALNHQRECIQCGQCLLGCTENVLFNAGTTLREWIKMGRLQNFEYRPQSMFLAFKEEKDSLQISYRDLRDGSLQEMKADYLFLGSGCISTAQILYRSGLLPKEQTVTMKDGQYFLVPTFSPYATSTPPYELSQLFIELDPLKKEGGHKIHLQVYPPSDLYRQMSPFNKLPAALRATLANRFYPMQGFIHSNFSGTIQLKYLSDEKMQLTAHPNPDSKKEIKQTLRRYLRKFWQVGLYPIIPATRFEAPGRSYHFGAYLPMEKAAISGSSVDLYGRPANTTRVSIVDSSILKAIPAQTITLSVMTNAHRIARHVGSTL